MNMREKRLDKLEAEIGVGKHKPGKFYIYDIWDGVKTLRSARVMKTPGVKNDGKDIVLEITHIYPNPEDVDNGKEY